MSEEQNKPDPNANKTDTDDDNIDEYSLIASGKRILDEEKQSVLFEILKCAVCLEIPKGKQNLQVRICEKGHHFCSPCHKKLRNCAICRGRLFIGRNFVVEELITKLGPQLGVSRHKIPIPEATPKESPGQFSCLHLCTSILPAGKMLQHIRKTHPSNLLENVRSNPYNNSFDCVFNVTWSPNTSFVFSAHISDFGLFTTVVYFNESNLNAWIQRLGDNTLSSSFKYRISARISQENDVTSEFTLANCTVFCYNDKENDILTTKRYLKVSKENLEEFLKIGDSFEILISIWKGKEKRTNKDFDVFTVNPVPNVFPNDRKARRNSNRNKRRKLLKTRLKETRQLESSDSSSEDTTQQERTGSEEFIALHDCLRRLGLEVINLP